mgnify:CR=1 FL=1
MTDFLDGVEAVLYDFGGVFTTSPFDEVERAGEEQKLPAGRLLEIVFGPYHEDTDHPWHRLERGEISLLEARDGILELGRREGVDSDPLQLLARMSEDGGVRESLVKRAIRIHQKGFPTALVTNNVSEFRERWKTMIPTEELFDVIVDSSEVGLRKPDPAIYELALERIGGGAPESALFLDDHPNNVRAAERLGIRGLLVTAELDPTLRVLDALIERGPRTN